MFSGNTNLLNLVGVGVLPLNTLCIPTTTSVFHKNILFSKKRSVNSSLRYLSIQPHTNTNKLYNSTHFNDLNFLHKLNLLGFSFTNYNTLKYQYPSSYLLTSEKNKPDTYDFSRNNRIILPITFSIYSLYTHLTLYKVLNPQ